MSGYDLTPLAKADIFDIWAYIADDNEDAADRVERAIYDAWGAHAAAIGSHPNVARKILLTAKAQRKTKNQYLCVSASLR